MHNFWEQRGYRVSTATAGKEALIKFNLDVANIVVYHISRLEMDGFEFCHQLRSQPSRKLLPSIFFSAKTGLDDRIGGQTINADSYLGKPFEMKELKSQY